MAILYGAESLSKALSGWVENIPFTEAISVSLSLFIIQYLP